MGVGNDLVLVSGSILAWSLFRGIETDLLLEWGSNCLDFSGGVDVKLIFVWGIEFDFVLLLGSELFFLLCGGSKLTLRAEKLTCF